MKDAIQEASDEAVKLLMLQGHYRALIRICKEHLSEHGCDPRELAPCREFQQRIEAQAMKRPRRGPLTITPLPRSLKEVS